MKRMIVVNFTKIGCTECNILLMIKLMFEICTVMIIPVLPSSPAGYPKTCQFKLRLETGFHFKYLLNRDSWYFSFKIL